DGCAVPAIDGEVTALHVEGADGRVQRVRGRKESASQAVVRRGGAVVEQEVTARRDRVSLEADGAATGPQVHRAVRDVERAVRGRLVVVGQSPGARAD